MRWSKSFLPTLRDDPADAEAVSHKLLIRAGFVRQLVAGVYSLLPLGFRVVNKIAGIVRDEMQKIGGQEFLLPALQPADLWRRSGRWEEMGQEMFKFTDRHSDLLQRAITKRHGINSLCLYLSSLFCYLGRQALKLWPATHVESKRRDLIK